MAGNSEAAESQNDVGFIENNFEKMNIQIEQTLGMEFQPKLQQLVNCTRCNSRPSKSGKCDMCSTNVANGKIKKKTSHNSKALTKSNREKLPTEVWGHVMSFLSEQALKVCCEVSPDFRKKAVEEMARQKLAKDKEKTEAEMKTVSAVDN